LLSVCFVCFVHIFYVANETLFFSTDEK
jgi:hypothetical protein